ncbi:hypothetical protein EYF80_007824 [Liparis tanakae]|uniref:Uncharacterized protein n=1 Tax=Liparis tanakae TaxID=230148 RepID=A0A4Z2IVK3_9TELE|nr:hypothetical protein EYF80_007824 [Liparis tanakae]
MRADWRTEAADRRQTGHWRLGLTIVLQRPRHGPQATRDGLHSTSSNQPFTGGQLLQPARFAGSAGGTGGWRDGRPGRTRTRNTVIRASCHNTHACYRYLYMRAGTGTQSCEKR